jgi:enterochelin esterase family protein
VVDKQGFVDAPCAGNDDNFYFSDMRSEQGIFRVLPDGKVEPFVKAKGVSGMKFGPDGRLYCAQGSQKRIIAVDPRTGDTTVLATNVQPNDLVVARNGHVFFTETGKKQVTLLVPTTGELRAVDTGNITAPNGISLSRSQGMLAVSDYRGVHVWTFRVEPNGDLTARMPYMTMRTPPDLDATGNRMRAPDYKTTSGGDGMTTDTMGRFYVATTLGVQVFDPTGRHCGVLTKPADKSMTSVTLAGPKHEYLYVTCGDTIYRRKVLAEGTHRLK